MTLILSIDAVYRPSFHTRDLYRFYYSSFHLIHNNICLHTSFVFALLA